MYLPHPKGPLRILIELPCLDTSQFLHVVDGRRNFRLLVDATDSS